MSFFIYTICSCLIFNYVLESFHENLTTTSRNWFLNKKCDFLGGASSGSNELLTTLQDLISFRPCGNERQGQVLRRASDF